MSQILGLSCTQFYLQIALVVAVATTVNLVGKISEPLTLVISNSPFHILWYLGFQLGFLVKVQPEMACWV